MTDLVVLASFPTPLEAHLLRTALEAEGIPCLLANEQIIGANPLWANLMGGVQVQVRREDFARAQEIWQG